MSDIKQTAHNASRGRLTRVSTPSEVPAMFAELPSYLLMSRETLYDLARDDLDRTYVSFSTLKNERTKVCGVEVILDDYQPKGAIQSVYGATSHG